MSGSRRLGRIDRLYLGAAVTLVISGIVILGVNALLLASLPTGPPYPCGGGTACLVNESTTSFGVTVAVDLVAGAVLVGLGAVVALGGLARARRVAGEANPPS